MTTTEVTALAEGLSKAQRDVLFAPEGMTSISQEVTYSLLTAGLYEVHVTPLGLAVRKHLLASGGA